MRTLRNAVQQDKVHHAYLFVGSRGTGKTSMAKILAACLNCEQGPTVTPCGTCESCVAIAAATSMDVIEMDAASNNSVDDIRDLRDSVAFAPVSGRSKVYILDEAHMLSPQAWNAFLKTLEEPPPGTIFVLATTEAKKVLPTVVDRCHRFDFTRPTVEQITGVLRRVAAEEDIEVPAEALALLARHATGSFRDALGTLEQLVTYSGQAITTEDVLAVLGVADTDLLFEALDAIAGRDARAALLAAARLVDTGRDPTVFVKDLEAHARDVMVVQALGELPAELRLTPDRDARLVDQASRIGRAEVARLLDLLAQALEAGGNGADARTQLELALVKAASPEVDPSVKALLARIEMLESGRPPAAPAPIAPPPASAPAAPVQEAGPPASAIVEESPARESGGPADAVPTDSGGSADGIGADLEGLRDVWPAVLDHLKTTNMLCASILAESRPVALQAGELTVAFPPGSEFLRRRADSEAYRACVIEALRAVTGQAPTLAYELRELEEGLAATGGGDGVGAGAVPRALTEDEWVARFVTEFDAEEIIPEAPPEETA
ncbi:MAG: polymerase subunit gamma/tau [Solirubrobacteraceae bacterium]|nr:polymerase subunit gamma/tau [Solirubrobacteraceae bacterium]